MTKSGRRVTIRAARFFAMTTVLEILSNSYAELHSRSKRLLESTRDDELFRRPRELPNTMAMFSIGEYILRSAGAVEHVFGGITTRLWDDPFEWTLPEELEDVRRVRQYLEEVNETRLRGFRFLASDADLLKLVPAPENLRPIAELLVEAYGRAAHFQGRAYAVFQMLSDRKLPRL